MLVYSLDTNNVNVKVSDFGLSRELEAGVAATMTSECIPTTSAAVMLMW